MMNIEEDTVYFSKRNAVLAETRGAAHKGRIQKVLGKNKTFSDAYRDAILNDYACVLERPYLVKELEAYKKISLALTRSSEPAAKSLLEKMQSDPKGRKRENIFCPIWKQYRFHELTMAAISRYFFPTKANELSLLTVVMDFAENLSALEDKISEARSTIDRIIRSLTKQQRGLVIIGAFEPDLRSHEDYSKPGSADNALIRQLGITPPDTGGWTLTGHFIIRAAQADWIREEFAKHYPCVGKGWKRVTSVTLSKDKSLAAATMDILGYAAKFPKPLFGHPTRGSGYRRANKKINALRTAFDGPSLSNLNTDSSFDLNAAIRQWAIFMDRLGSGKILYAKESSYAQRWYSDSEWNYIRDMNVDVFEKHGESLQRCELHRGHSFYDGQLHQRLKGRCRRITTRNIRYDEEWIAATDIGVGPYWGIPVCLDSWITKNP